MSEPIGSVLDSLDVKVTLDEGALVAGAIVLLKVIDPDGDSVLQCTSSAGLAWVERLGMLHAAEIMERPNTYQEVGE